MRLIIAMTALVVLSGCERKPENYYVWCEGRDGNGWNLIDTEKRDGYLISCTYQSPDRSQIYTARCNDDGCD
jgi:hypothetical protein